jgi:hypothetical protein
MKKQIIISVVMGVAALIFILVPALSHAGPVLRTTDQNLNVLETSEKLFQPKIQIQKTDQLQKERTQVVSPSQLEAIPEQIYKRWCDNYSTEGVLKGYYAYPRHILLSSSTRAMWRLGPDIIELVDWNHDGCFDSVVKARGFKSATSLHPQVAILYQAMFEVSSAIKDNFIAALENAEFQSDGDDKFSFHHNNEIIPIRVYEGFWGFENRRCGIFKFFADPKLKTFMNLLPQAAIKEDLLRGWDLEVLIEIRYDAPEVMVSLLENLFRAMVCSPDPGSEQ